MDSNDFLDGLRRAGLLVEFHREEWAAYARKHFGPAARASLDLGTPPADPRDQGWKDEHRLEYDSDDPDL